MGFMDNSILKRIYICNPLNALFIKGYNGSLINSSVDGKKNNILFSSINIGNKKYLLVSCEINKLLGQVV